MNYLNKRVSIYRNVTDNAGTTTELNTFLLSAKYKDDIDYLRTITDKEKRNELKRQLPCITVSGIFEPTRKRENLTEHSGLLCIDIDGQDNRHIQNFANLKNQLSKLDEVLYCGISASGNGYFAIIPIKYPQYHKEHFKALQNDFNNYGIIIDSNCGDVTRLRCYAYDAKPYINENAKVYSRLVFPDSKPKLYANNLNINDNISKIVAYACKYGIDMTDNYNNWFIVGSSLASELGESGREYFHVLSRISSKYNYAECDKKYNECLKTNRFTIGTFFYFAKQHSINA